MGKLRLEHIGHAELLPKSPTDATDLDLVIQVICLNSVKERSSCVQQLSEGRQWARSAASGSLRPSSRLLSVGRVVQDFVFC